MAILYANKGKTQGYFVLKQVGNHMEVSLKAFKNGIMGGYIESLPTSQKQCSTETEPVEVGHG